MTNKYDIDIENANLDKYVYFGSSIIAACIRDYKRALAVHRSKPNDNFAITEIERCERFFHGWLCQTVSNITGMAFGNELIALIKESKNIKSLIKNEKIKKNT